MSEDKNWTWSQAKTSGSLFKRSSWETNLIYLQSLENLSNVKPNVQVKLIKLFFFYFVFEYFSNKQEKIVATVGASIKFSD